MEPGETLLWQAQAEVPSITNPLGVLLSLVAMLAGVGRVDSPVATCMVSLDRGDASVELTGMAQTDQTQVRYAIDAIVDSLSC